MTFRRKAVKEVWLGLSDPEDEGTKVLRNVANKLPVYTAYTSQQILLLSHMISCQQVARFPTTSLKSLRPSVTSRSTEQLHFCYELYVLCLSLLQNFLTEPHTLPHQPYAPHSSLLSIWLLAEREHLVRGTPVSVGNRTCDGVRNLQMGKNVPFLKGFER